MAEHAPGPDAEGSDPTHSDALIDEAGEESFPASDPPATWSGVDRRDLDADQATQAEPVSGPATNSG